MATVRPLTALRFAPERVDVPLLLAPPGAVGPDERQALHEREPRNAVRLLEDGAVDDVSAAAAARRAALHLAEWRRAGVLVRDEHPALYLVRLTRDDDEGGAPRTTLGFFAGLRLDAAAERDVTVSPHASPLDEGLVGIHRLHLEATAVQTGAALFAYADESGRIERALRAELEEREPDLRGRAFGGAYELWIVDDDTTSARVTRQLEEQALTLVAGHERYQAAWLVERARGDAHALGASERAVVAALGFFVKADATSLDEREALAALPPRGLVLAPLVAAGDDDG